MYFIVVYLQMIFYIVCNVWI